MNSPNPVVVNVTIVKYRVTVNLPQLLYSSRLNLLNTYTFDKNFPVLRLFGYKLLSTINKIDKTPKEKI